VPALILPDRSLIRVEGADAQHFLQNLITTNIDAIAPGEAWPAALLTPQGKILFDFLISKSGETGYDCDIRTDQAADFIRRLTLYKLRASVQFNRLEDQPVIAGWDEDAPRGALRDRRFPEEAHVWRLHGTGAVLDGKPADWDAVRIAHGVAESGVDFALSDVFPHDVLMDRNGGVDFQKGLLCRPGSGLPHAAPRHGPAPCGDADGTSRPARPPRQRERQ
jgi:folate-binding Fe-S cluster repair protein YgfZ